jgi:hypothetical protein
MSGQVYTQAELITAGWIFTTVDNTGTFTVTGSKTLVEADETETVFTYSKTEVLEADALAVVIIYASMVEYSILVDLWMPQDLAFPREQLYQFIQPATLEQLEGMYPNVVINAYNNALAYVQSYIGAMFDVQVMLEQGGSTSTALTLRLALCISTVTFILASSPQYSEVIELQSKQLHWLLRGLKSGNRNFGKDAIVGDPDVRFSSVSLSKTGNRP